MGGATLWIYAWGYILDTDGNWRDFTSLTPLAGGLTYDYFDSFTWTEDIDVPVAQGQMTLRRQVGGLSLAPTMSASGLNLNAAGTYVPLLSTGREFKVVVAAVPFGTPRASVASGDLIEIARGKVDRVDWTADPVKLTLRDDGAWLQNAFIQNLVNYGTGVGTLMEVVMQQIINDNAVKGGATVVTPVSPGFYLTPFTQSRVTVSSALNTLALQIGWDIRYRYNASNVSVLNFMEPPRTSTTSDFTIGPDEYTDVQQLTIDDANVRNLVRVIYADSTTGGVEQIDSDNPASIAEFGTRFYEITEQSSSNITTAAEATALGEAIVSDLGAPKADHIVITLLFWAVQLYDLFTLSANGKHYDQDQQMGVVAYTHTLKNGSGSTSVSVRGQLAGAYQKWINRFGLNTVQLFPPPSPSFVVTAAGSPDGGVTMDGSVYIQIGFEPNTDSVYIYSETAATQNVPVPDESDNTRAALVFRPAPPDGGPYWTTTIRIATTNGWWRCVKCFGVGPSINGVPGQRSVPFIQTIQAGLPNTTAASLPAFQTFSVVRDADGVTGDLTWAIDLSSAPSNALIYIARNGQVITGTGLAQGTEAFQDTAAPTDANTNYTIYLFAAGVTGPAASATLVATNAAATAPIFDNGSPGYVEQISNNTRQVVVGWTCADTVADQIQLQVSTDGTNWDVVYDSGVVTPAAPPISSGAAYTTRVARQYMRLVTFIAGQQDLVSATALFIPIAAPPSGTLALATPYGSYTIGLGPSIQFSWVNPLPGGATMPLQFAHALGGPWTTRIALTAAMTGAYNDLADYSTALFWRIAVENNLGQVLGISPGVPWYPLPYTGFSAGTYIP